MFFIFISFPRTSEQILTKLGGDHPWGVGIQSYWYGACNPSGRQGRAPNGKGVKLVKSSFPDKIKTVVTIYVAYGYIFI